MQIVYKTIDGRIYENENDAREHEAKIYNGVIMLNRENKRVYETSRAFLVWLKDENANLAFHAMARGEGDDAVKSITEGEDYGLFYWDEGLEEYRWIDPDMAEGILAIRDLMKEQGGSF